MVIKRTRKRVSRKKVSQRGIARRGRTRRRVNRRGSQHGGAFRGSTSKTFRCRFEGCTNTFTTRQELNKHLRENPTHRIRGLYPKRGQSTTASARAGQELLVVRVKIPRAAAWKPIGDMVWNMGTKKVVIEGDYRRYKFDTVPYPTHADMATLCREVAEMCALAGKGDVTWTVKVGTPPYDVVPTTGSATGSAGASVRVPNITWTASGTPPPPVAAVTSTSMYSTPASMADQW